MSVDPVTRKLAVTVLNDTKVNNCLYMSDSLAALLGFEQATLPCVGAHVLVLYAPKQSYVMGAVGATRVDDPSVFSVPAAGNPDSEMLNDPAFGVRRGKQGKELAGGYTPGKDILPGEKEFSNNMGVWLRLLMNMAQLSAGELAKIEVSLVNDMVRIVDNYFAHHNVGGDTLIWAANGKCTEESHFTPNGFEAEGKMSAKEKLAESESCVVDPSSIGNPVNATGRWRKSTYIGFLGDMIHTWVSAPAETLSNYADGAVRTGNCRCWIGQDGTVMVNSAGGVHIQVTPIVVIPEVKHNWNDPDFDVAQAFANLDKNFLKLWGGDSNEPWKDMSVACWQMRTWAQYIRLWHSLKVWNALTKSEYCAVHSEKDSTYSDIFSQKGTAFISVDAGGSIALTSYGTQEAGGTSSIIMNNGSIQIATAGNLDIQCGGTLSVSAKNIAMKALDHIEIVAIAGALWLKARSAWNALCEAGRMWLKSDLADTYSSDISYTYPQEGGSPPEPQETGRYAICIDAAEGRVAMHGKKEVSVATSDPYAPIRVNAKGTMSPIYVQSNGDMLFDSWSNISMGAARNMCTRSYGLLMDCNTARIARNMLVTSATIEFNGFIRTNSVISLNGYIGNAAQVGVYKEKDKADPAPVIEKNNESMFNDLEKYVNTSFYPEVYPLYAEDYIDEVWNSYDWHFTDWNVGAGDDVLQWYTYKSSPVFQENGMWPADETLASVSWDKCGLISPSSTTGSLEPERGKWPFPGKKMEMWSHSFKDVGYDENFFAGHMQSAANGDPSNGGIDKMKKVDYTFLAQKATI